MMFLLRLAFWILVICLLLPSSPGDNRRLMSSAERTVSDVRGFCQRNPDVCEDMRITMTSMLAKLKNGAEAIQAWLAHNDKSGEGSGIAPSARAKAEGQTPSKGLRQPPRFMPDWQDSLNPADKQMPWRGPAHL
jgi:Family of unknown function (DUF5330)